MRLLDYFLKETIGLDPGSRYLRIIKDGNLIFNEESQISIDKVNTVVSGIGSSIGKTKNDVVLRPVNYAIADFQAFEMLLRSAIKKTIPSGSFFTKSYRMLYCIPTGTTEVDRRAYRDSAEHAGAIEVYMIHQSLCSAIGMNLLSEKRHFIIIDFSSSKVEISVFANEILISHGMIRLGTDRILNLLKNFFRRKYKIEMSEMEVEDILKTLQHDDPQDKIEVQDINITKKEIQEQLESFFNLVNDEVLKTIEEVSNHADIDKVMANGIYFTGGGSANDFLRDQIVVDKTMERNISQSPLLDNINGLKKVMADQKKYKHCLMT